MNRVAIRLVLGATAALAVSAPAEAQVNHANMPGMHMPGMVMPAAKKPPARKPAATKTPAKKPAVKKAAAKRSVGTAKAAKAVRKKAEVKRAAATTGDPHAGHDMSSMRGTDMPAGQDLSAMPDMPAQQADPHAAHDMTAMTPAAPAGTDLPAGTSPPPPVPADRAADAVYGAEAMHMGRHHLDAFHGGQKFSQIMFNVAEAQFRNGRDGFEWDGQAWYGGDIDRLWLKSQAEGQFGRSFERAEVQALYSRAIGPYFNLQGGLRYDFKPDPSRVYATVGFEGLAPGFLDVEGALFLSSKGELMARAEGYYDQRLTQRLILQPRAELNFAAQSSRDIGVGKGLSDAELGLRLRYDIRREFAPYVGVQYRRAFGDTRRYLQDAGEKARGWSLLTGVRMWF